MFKISKKGLLIGIILLLIIVSGCSTTKEVEEVNKESSQETNRKVELTTLDELYSLKLPFIPSDVSIEEYIDPDQTVENLLNLVVETISEGKSTYVKSISKEDVMEDIDKYFSYLKGGYAGYLANGGDEAFNKAKAAIIDNIYDGIDSIKLSKLFEVEMKFVNDAHFTIGGLNTMEKAKKWYYVEKLQMGEDENGYYNLNTGEYIKNQSELEPFLKPSLNSDGMLCFILVAFEEDLEKVPKEIIYSDNSKLYISFSQVRSMYHRDIEPTFSDNSIPYLSMKSCYMSNEKEFVDFVLKSAEKMSEAPIAILDLRGNFGGDGITSNKWIQAYSGEEPQNSATFVTIISEKSFIDNTYGQTWEEYTEFSKDEIYDDNLL